MDRGIGELQKSIIIAIIGTVAVIAAIGWSVMGSWQERQDKPKTQPPVTEQQAPKTEILDVQQKTKAEDLIPPTFDVVRVNPRGDAVMAGHAHPHSRIEIKDWDNVIGEVKADARGEWVFVPEKPLEPGKRQLGLVMYVDDLDPVESKTVVAVVVPEVGQGQGDALAVEMDRFGKGPSRVLQTPGTPEEKPTITIEAVDYEAGGPVIISGRAPPKSTVQLYLSNDLLARTEADDNGRWLVKPETPIAPGLYTLRADLVDDKGKVLARAETPFSRAEEAVAEKELSDPDKTTYIVQPGNSLWRIARRNYGTGFSYTVIYEANKGQISDPDLIYPGQVFSIPNK